MLERRSTYSQLDAEQQNPTVHTGLSVTTAALGLTAAATATS